MFYCNKRGVPCKDATVDGACYRTGGCNRLFVGFNHSSNKPVYIEYPNALSVPSTHMKTVRACEICGNGTEDLNHYICPKCRKGLYDLLYGGQASVY